MTRKIYEENAYTAQFDARVTACAAREGGFAVVLDQTAFYPEGGGQPCDLGTLGGAKVLDVHERPEGIVHLCDRALEVGARVHGEIDWERRFDLMQQHSGEHLVSGVVHSRFGYENVGFHMGGECITIDFDGPLTREMLADVEQTVNREIWKNLHTEIFDFDPAHPVPYRSKKALTGRVRLVRFPGVDTCACCGTHVRMTGEIGLVKILSCVKFHDGARVEMLSGRRALERLSDFAEQNRRISALVSAKPEDTAKEVARLLEELRQTKYRLVGYQNQHIRARAACLAGRGDVLVIEDGLTGDAPGKLASAGMERCGGLCAVFSGGDETGYIYAIAMPDGDVAAFTKQMNAALSGRGGGRGGFAQGKVGASRAQIIDFFAGKRIFPA